MRIRTWEAETIVLLAKDDTDTVFAAEGDDEAGV